MAHDPQELTIQRISRAEAARAFAACAGLDPEKQATPESAAAAGECFSVAGPRGAVAVAVAFGGGVAWISAAAGGGDRMAGTTLQAIESMARQRGCHVVAFQTMRQGLQRIAQRRGYTITGQIGAGVILEKHT